MLISLRVGGNHYTSGPRGFCGAHERVPFVRHKEAPGEISDGATGGITEPKAGS
jgi:hypothetical protein